MSPVLVGGQQTHLPHFLCRSAGVAQSSVQPYGIGPLRAWKPTLSCLLGHCSCIPPMVYHSRATCLQVCFCMQCLSTCLTALGNKRRGICVTWSWKLAIHTRGSSYSYKRFSLIRGRPIGREEERIGPRRSRCLNSAWLCGQRLENTMQ